MEDAAVDDHHLAVIADQIVGGPRNGDAALEQVHLELAKALLAAAVGNARSARAPTPRATAPERAPISRRSSRKIRTSIVLPGLLDGGDDRGDPASGSTMSFIPSTTSSAGANSWANWRRGTAMAALTVGQRRECRR